MITVKNLTKIYRTHTKNQNFFADIFFRKYKETIALDRVSFEIGQNELVGFIGPNGAGKTTTLKILSGILYPTSGTVRVLSYIPFEKKKELLRQISFVMGQRNQLIWDIPAYDSFTLNKEIYEIPEEQFEKTVNELSELLNCRHLLKNPVKTLSLGERMKMELIAGLLHRPRLVFFDEPTIGLDLFSQETIRDFIREYQSKFAATIILTSHYLEDVKRLAKRLIIINHGKIIYDGSLEKITTKYSREKTIRITLEKSVDKKNLTAINPAFFYKFPEVKFKIEKKNLPKTINLINESLPFSDLTIEEEPIEEIIKKFFSENK